MAAELADRKAAPAKRADGRSESGGDQGCLALDARRTHAVGEGPPGSEAGQ
jgi:hypothetical protein